MEALGTSARGFLGQCEAVLNEEHHRDHPVDINSVAHYRGPRPYSMNWRGHYSPVRTR
ncbi:hypothetical protein L226DRAFT_214844 [Lentinus tigrinus ALCF2SS1-7]|uniref:Uncharacterized protein n=1 Tax=Lentinus tigrinus ALCF2SS1-6 TaxID=1328759 RepID=A0A5C2RZ04_9APHY|nr:hypothetical protein L227DRAFT_284552 [Lentinus tigrinus ALCF2SS1-6]RPD71081.1 hypothetical protein L226DRAFT_214844 [Lentinus tigrinus ALCF2SS1-7]